MVVRRNLVPRRRRIVQRLHPFALHQDALPRTAIRQLVRERLLLQLVDIIKGPGSPLLMGAKNWWPIFTIVSLHSTGFAKSLRLRKLKPLGIPTWPQAD